MISRVTIGLLAGWLSASLATAQTCQYIQVDPGNGKFRVDTLDIDLGAADSDAKPTAWQGPITSTTPVGASCTVDPAVSIVERPIFSDGHRLVVTTYSGSNRVVFAIDAGTCQVLWRSHPFVGQVQLKAGTLRTGDHSMKLGANCLP